MSSGFLNLMLLNSLWGRTYQLVNPIEIGTGIGSDGSAAISVTFGVVKPSIPSDTFR